MSKVLIVSRVSSEPQNNDSQLVNLRHYCSEKKLGIPNELEMKISGWEDKSAVAYHSSILKKLEKMNNESATEGSGVMNFLAKMCLSKPKYKIIFTDPNRLSRNVNLLKQFFKNLKELSMTIEFIFTCDEVKGKREEDKVSFIFDGSTETPGNEKFWGIVGDGEASSREKSRMNKASNQAKRKRQEDNIVTNKHSWITLHNFVKETLGQGESYVTIRDTIEADCDQAIPISHLEYYNSIEGDDADAYRRVQCTKCEKWRWVSKELYEENDRNPDAPFSCSMLIHCSCNIPMIYEDDPEYKEPELESGGGGGPVTKSYDLNYIIESRFSMNHDEYIYHVKWKRLRKNNPAWHTETQLIGWGLDRYLDLYKKKNDEFFNPDSKRARK